MRIAVANWTNRRAGGAETYLAQIVPALVSRHEVFFWHEREEPADRGLIGVEASASSAVNAVGWESAGRALADWRPDVLLINGLTNPDHERALLAIAPAVFFAHGYYGTCITGSKTFGVPTVEPCTRRFGAACLAHFYPRRCGGLSPLTMIADYRRQAARLANLRRCRDIVTFSEHMRQEYLHHGFAAARVHRLPPVSGHADTPGESAPLAASDDRQPVHLAFLGRLDRLKGCHVLLAALPRVHLQLGRPMVLSIAGTGPQLAACRALATNITATHPGVEIRFLDWISPDRARQLMAASDMVVMPSLWPEPFGLVGIEALRQGAPVAAFAVGGIPEWLVDGDNGVLAPADPPTPEGLADAIVRGLRSPSIARHTREHAAADLPAVSIDSHVAALLRILESARHSSASRTGVPA